MTKSLYRWMQANVPAIQQQLWFKGEELPNSVRLSAAGILEDSMLTLVMSTFSRYFICITLQLT